MTQRSTRTATHGFSLIELLVVIAILSVIAAIVAPNLLGKADDANVNATKIQLEQVTAAIDLYRLETGKYLLFVGRFVPGKLHRHQRGPVQLAVLGPRPAVEDDERRRDHVARQAGAALGLPAVLLPPATG